MVVVECIFILKCVHRRRYLLPVLACLAVCIFGVIGTLLF